MSMNNIQPTRFNEAQLHILDLASHIKTQQGIEQLKEQLTLFYAKLIDQEMDKLWETGEWNEQKLEQLQNTHLRTHYKE